MKANSSPKPIDENYQCLMFCSINVLTTLSNYTEHKAYQSKKSKYKVKIGASEKGQVQVISLFLRLNLTGQHKTSIVHLLKLSGTSFWLDTTLHFSCCKIKWIYICIWWGCGKWPQFKCASIKKSELQWSSSFDRNCSKIEKYNETIPPIAKKN